MNRDAAYRAVTTLLDRYASLTYDRLRELADGETIESEIAENRQLISLSVDIRHSAEDSIRINVSAFGDNWWKTERIDESVLVKRPKA